MPIVLVPIDLPEGSRVIRVELMSRDDKLTHTVCAGPIVFTKEQALGTLGVDRKPSLEDRVAKLEERMTRAEQEQD